MTRKIVVREGEPWLPTQKILPGSLHWEEGSIPICGSNNDFSKPPIGQATDFQRDEDSVITAEVGDLEIPTEHGLTVYCTDVVDEREGDVRVVSSARIRALFLADVPWKENA